MRFQAWGSCIKNRWPPSKSSSDPSGSLLASRSMFFGGAMRPLLAHRLALRHVRHTADHLRASWLRLTDRPAGQLSPIIEAK